MPLSEYRQPSYCKRLMGEGESGRVKGSQGRDMTEAGRQIKQVRETRKARENCAWQTLLRDAHVA